MFLTSQLVLFLGSTALLLAQSDASPNPARLPTVSVCELLAAPLEYDGKLIRIRDLTKGTDEGLWLSTNLCPGVFVTDGFEWPTLIYVIYPLDELLTRAVDFGFDWTSSERANRRYKELRRTYPDDCILWTYTGLFETRREWQMMVIGKPRGFGHLSAAPGQLIAKSVDDVSPMPNCAAKPASQATKSKGVGESRRK